MTQTEYDNLIEKPPYPCTIDDEFGKPVMIRYPNGTFITANPSNIGERFTQNGINCEVVWSGGPLLPLGGPAYVDSTHVIAWMAKEIFSEDDELTDTDNETRLDETPPRVGVHPPKTTKRNRISGKTKSNKTKGQ